MPGRQIEFDWLVVNKHTTEATAKRGANVPAPRLTWLAAAGAASVSSFLASLVIGRSEDGRRISGAEPHDGPTMGHSAGLFHYLAFPQGSI